jgi:uncharacterized protein with PQ loop repeat
MSSIGSTEMIAIFANLFEAICNFPIIISIVKNKEFNDLGVSFGIFRLVSSILWIIYGIKTDLFLATFSNYFNMIGSTILIFHNLKSSRPKSEELITENSSDDNLPNFVYYNKSRVL